MDFRGRAVVVTGASGGIGERFALRLAARGAVVVAVARSEEQLGRVAEAAGRSGGTVHVVPLDLMSEGAGDRLQQRVQELGLQVEGLVNNAGMGTNGPFVELPMARALAQVDLDVRTVVELTGLFLPGMIARRSGWVINVGSTSAFQPVPGMAVYAAAKAFVRSFTEALWYEARPAGVRVIGIAPGGVEAGFFAAAGKEFLTKGRLSPERVVDVALAFLDRSGPTVVPGLRNRLGTLGERFAPRRLLIGVSARLVAPVESAPHRARRTA